MDTCNVCTRPLNSGRAITCSGTCGTAFHHTCVGLTKVQYSSWTASVGLFWFCNACRLNFEPAVYDREKTIMKALRELMIRTDSMDTRLGVYGENLRKINSIIYGKQQQNQQNKPTHQSTFLHDLNRLTLDETLDDRTNNTRSCCDTSFFEVIDEINGTIARPTEKFVVGPNKRVRILPFQTTNISRPTSSIPPRNNLSCQSTPTQTLNRSTIVDNITTQDAGNRSRIDSDAASRVKTGCTTRPNTAFLKVAKKDQADSDMVSFYVTPFAPEQNENDLKKHIHDIVNIDSSLLKITKLVPRGKSLEDLSFVSFKVVISKAVSEIVGDSWYWPDGVTVRMFEPNQKNGSSIRHLTAT